MSMRICILHIGHFDPGSNSAHPPSPERFKVALKPHLPKTDWFVVSPVSDSLPDIGDFDAYLITGGKYSVFDSLVWQDRLFEFIRDLIAAKIPLIGICYGQQAIARALGAGVDRSPRGWGVGLMPVQVVRETEWCRVREIPYMLHAMHQDQVTELPDSATLFLSSDFCPISGFSINDRVLAIQQHPDFTPALSRDLIEKRRERIGENTAESAITSLSGTDETQSSVKWMAKFLTLAFSTEPGAAHLS